YDPKSGQPSNGSSNSSSSDRSSSLSSLSDFDDDNDDDDDDGDDDAEDKRWCHEGWTPLHEACLKGCATVTELLIADGADVNVPGYTSNVPLYNTVSNGHFVALDAL
ncbi:BRCA1-associated RING domain protein 1, partial [Cladochytrium tenue]